MKLRGQCWFALPGLLTACVSGGAGSRPAANGGGDASSADEAGPAAVACPTPRSSTDVSAFFALRGGVEVSRSRRGSDPWQVGVRASLVLDGPQLPGRPPWAMNYDD